MERYGIQRESLAGKIALVTGGSQGIGRATCIELAARGAAIAVHYRSHAEEAESVAAQICASGGKAIAIQADLARPSDPGSLVKAVMDQLGEIDILVNNAGEMTDSSVADMSDEMWDRTLTVNLTAIFRCCRACIPAMVRR